MTYSVLPTTTNGPRHQEHFPSSQENLTFLLFTFWFNSYSLAAGDLTWSQQKLTSQKYEALKYRLTKTAESKKCDKQKTWSKKPSDELIHCF